MEQEDLEALSRQPSIEELEVLLFKPLSSPLQEFKLVNILINNILELYDDLTRPLQKQLISIFTSLSGISSLLSHIKTCSVKDQTKAATFANFLTKIIDTPNILYLLISKESTAVKLNEIKTLFFGSKILNAYGRLNAELGVECKYSYRLTFVEKLRKEYLVLLKANFVEYNYLAALLVGVLRLSDEGSFLILESLFSSEFICQFYLIYGGARSNKSAILAGIIKFLNHATKNEVDRQELTAWMSHFDIDFITLEEASRYSNILLLQILVYAVHPRKRPDFCLNALQTWGDSSYINRTPMALQESFTNLLVILIYSTDTSFLIKISENHEFLDAITNRIASTSDRIRSLGMLIGNLIFRRLGKEPIFNIDEVLAFEAEYLRKFENRPKSFSADASLSKIDNQFDKLVIIDSDEEFEEDLSDSDDDPTIVDRSKPNRPLFLKELIAYLNADPKSDKQAYDKIRLALTSGPKLILRSPLKNARFYNNSLISILIGLTNNYEDSDFDDLRLKCLISCCVQDPVEAPEIVLRNFIAGDYSLQQRLTLLSTLLLSVRYLRGHDDAAFQVDETKLEFRSKMLPPAAHRLFLNYDDKFSGLANLIGTDLETEIVEETLSNNRDKLMGQGTVLRVSSKLTKPKARSSTFVKARIPDFYKIVGSKFFFPLTSVWFTLDQTGAFRSGNFSAVLAAHMLKSIGLILHTTFPSCNDLQDVVKTSLEIVISVSNGMFRIRSGSQSNEDLLLLDSVLFIVLVILDSSSDQYLVDFYLNELVVVKNFIVGILNEELEAISVDELLLQKCFTVTFRLNEIFEKYERLLVGMEGVE